MKFFGLQKYWAQIPIDNKIPLTDMMVKYEFSIDKILEHFTKYHIILMRIRYKL